MNRREFLIQAAGSALTARLAVAAPSRRRHYRAAIIGATGQGNFGHNLDVIFNGHPAIEVVAVVDPNPAGRAKAKIRTRAQRAYADYRDMLDKERPDLVTVATRWSSLHYPRIMAALQSGAHVFCEKPLTETLAQGDEVLALAKAKGLRIANALQTHLAPGIVHLKRQLSAGVIGDLLEMRLHGKEDKRAGGEDMLVLGVHEFDLARSFAGSDPLWCAARIEQDGREVTRSDIHPATEGDGLVLGNQIQALFAFPGGLNVRYTSDARYFSPERSFGMELLGNRGRIHFTLGFTPKIRILSQTHRGLEDIDAWRPLAGDPTPAVVDHEAEERDGNRRVVDDWLDAIETGREPACSGYAGLKALEMVHGVFAAGLARGRTEIPLKNRQHPLT